MQHGRRVAGRGYLRDAHGNGIQRDLNAARGIMRILLGFGAAYRQEAVQG